jgi:uncharacterized protein YbaP (TraB family)
MMKKRSVILITITLVLIGLFLSCTDSSSEDHSVTSVWKVSKNGKSLFLGGTHHYLRESDFPLPVAFNFAFDNSEILVFETDMEVMYYDTEMMEYFYKKGLLPEGETLQSILDGDVYERLEAKFTEADFSREMYSQYKPYMAMEVLLLLNRQKHGIDQPGIDEFYFLEAKKAGKELGSLETVKSHYDLVFSVTDGYGNDYVKDNLDMIDSNSDIKEAILYISEVLSGGRALIESFLYETKNSDPMFYKILIYDRNMAWMPQIETYLTNDPIEFVLVGAGHLHGPDGLLTQLKAKGYTVTQLGN